MFSSFFAYLLPVLEGEVAKARAYSAHVTVLSPTRHCLLREGTQLLMERDLFLPVVGSALHLVSIQSHRHVRPKDKEGHLLGLCRLGRVLNQSKEHVFRFILKAEK